MSSSSSSSSEGDGNGGGGGGGVGRVFQDPSSSRQRFGRARRGFEGPSSSRQRSGNGVWPEPFVEALASRVAIDASRSDGRIAAAPALANLFQVCSTWRAVSRSDLLWRDVTHRIWNRTRRLHDTWREEFIYRHRTALNFQTGRSFYTSLFFDPNDVGDDNAAALSCRCLALSDFHLACGFGDGAVRLFNLTTHLHTATFHPLPRDHHIGLFAAAVSGIIFINNNTRLVFATLEGDIHAAFVNNHSPARRAHEGNVVEDGALVDFSGCSRWWVGLYAGVAGQAFRIWDAVSEELLFLGGTLTDPESVVGWHLLAEELADFVGRVRVTGQESAVACTRARVMVFDPSNPENVVGVEEFNRRIIVGSFDANNEAFVIVDDRGLASVRRVGTLEEVCRFQSFQRRALGCMNGGYVLMCALGMTRVWEVVHGVYLYSFAQRIGVASCFIADDRYVAACTTNTTIHLWDFGAQ